MTKLVAIATRHGLPMPPATSRLVLAHTESWLCLGSHSTSRDPGVYSPAYLLEEKPDGSIRILRGAEEVTLVPIRGREPLWRPFSALVVVPEYGGYDVEFSRLSAFVCAVQTGAADKDDIAQDIWYRFALAEQWVDGRPHEDVSAQLRDPNLLLARCIFDHLRNRLLQEKSDWKEIHDRMAALLKEFPELKADWRDDLFKDLTTTLNAGPPPKDSVEALLLDWSRRPNHLCDWGLSRERRPDDPDAPAREIVRRGYSAVPDLLRLLKDRRVTAWESGACMNAPAEIQRVGELAHELIVQISGNQLPFTMAGDDTGAILRWWKSVQGKDEIDSVFSREGERIVNVNDGPVRIVGQRCPEKLAGLCEAFSKHAAPAAQPYALAEALAHSSLPQETRVRLLSEFAQRGTLAHKRSYLQNLAALDGAACTRLLLPLLSALPTDVAGPYWTCTEAGFTHVVMQLESNAVWSAYLAAAKRSSVGLRMEMMAPMDYCYIGTKNRERRLAFLGAFLDDAAVRDLSGDRGKEAERLASGKEVKFDGPCAGFTIPRLQVRDFAAMTAAVVLGLKEQPDEFWTEAQWRELRDKVRKQLASLSLPKLQ